MNGEKNNCVICGSELNYYQRARKFECVLCHRKFEDTVACIKGHYICNECHTENGIALISEVCKHSAEKDPIQLAQHLMTQPGIHMHGPEHHVLVGAVLLTAYHNNGGIGDLRTAMNEMVRRGQQVPGGICGFWGCCGAAVSTGIFISLITGATPLANKEWKLANLMTAAALQKIGEIGGPRCCKRNSFTAILTAVEYVKKKFDLEIPCQQPVACHFSSLNKECIGERCKFRE